MSLKDLENHLKLETESFNKNPKNTNWLITSLIGFHPKLFKDVKNSIKNYELNNQYYKWVIFSNKNARGFYFLEIWSIKEIKSKTKQKLYGKNYLKYIGYL